MAYASVDPVHLAPGITEFRERVETSEMLAIAARRRIDDEVLLGMVSKSRRVSVAIKKHWDMVAALGCIITNQPAEIAHCHGGSISLELGPLFRPGIAERQNHWLVLPLNPALHRGQFGLDTSSVEEWELAYGLQTTLLEEVSHRLGYCVFRRAKVANYEYRAFNRPAA